MLNSIVYLGIALSLLAADVFGPHNSKDVNLIIQYYQAYNTKDFNKLNSLISDSITVVEMNQLVLSSKPRFIDLVQWGQVFNSKNEIDSIVEGSDGYIVFETQDSERIRFLHKNPLKARTLIFIDNYKINKIDVELLNYSDAYMRSQLNGLMSWLNRNNPVKLEMVHQLNQQGGQVFLESMKSYEESINDSLVPIKTDN